ncbi:MAG: alpha/beta fold hydrolase [Verrucomicrobiota bacterium]
MRAFFAYAVLSVALFSTEQVTAFPPAVANFILGRPITERSLEEQMRWADTLTLPIIEGTDAISRLEIPVGSPPIKLSVLVVEPRNYSIHVEETVAASEGNEANFKLSIYIDETNAFESTIKIMEEVRAEAGGRRKFKTTPEQIERIVREQVRVGGATPTTEDPRTVFLLLGYGVPKRIGLPMALLLANHGIRTVIVDLRGQGKSGGKGVTWGKEEPKDLAALLTALQSKEVIEEKPVAVLGVSYGAVMASLWSAQDERVEATILAAPYQRADTKIITTTQSFLGDTKLPFKPTQKSLTKGAEIAAKRLKMSWEELSSTRAIPKIPHPVLFLASSSDEIIPEDEVRELYQIGPEGSKHHVFDHLPHYLLGMNFRGMETVVVEWLEERNFLTP